MNDDGLRVRENLSMPNQRRLFWVLQLSGWSVYGVVNFLATVPYLPVHLAALNKSLNTATGLVLSLVLHRVCRQVNPLIPPRAPRAAIILASVFLLGLAWSAIASSAYRTAIGVDPFAVSVARYFDWSVPHAYALLAWATCYFALTQYLALQATREHALKNAALAREAELRALRYQLNPHFLFNSLNTVASLLLDQRNEDAHRMLLRLSGFLRGTLAGGAEHVTTLREEFAMVEDYLGIEAVRFRDRLRYEVHVAPEVIDARVPRLLLQPLVENAIRHGLRRLEQGGCISVNGQTANGRLELTVRDNGAGLDGVSGNAGVGLHNTRLRLATLYGEEATLELRPTQGGGTTATIRLPLNVSG
jgi:two-component system, LytTR family, sensor kinase